MHNYTLVEIYGVQYDVVKVFAFCGLEGTVETFGRVLSIENKLFAKPHSRDVDMDVFNKAIDRVLSDSPLMALFD